MAEECARHRMMRRRWHRDHGGIHVAKEETIVVQSARIPAGGDCPRLFDVHIGHTGELNSGQPGEDAGVFFPEMAYPNDADTESTHGLLRKGTAQAARFLLPNPWHLTSVP